MTPTPYMPSFLQRSPYRVNGYTFYMVRVEKGSFVMGDDTSGYGDEMPAHRVTLSADFELAEYPVTQGLWQAVMGAEWERTRTAFKGADRPVEGVSWDDAQDFFQKLNEWYRGSGDYGNHPGHFCLPTEAQWEYAARGGRYGDFFAYPFSGSNRLEEVGWYEENSHWETKPVGHKMPNALGLYDMSGNVFEWYADDWHDNYEGAPSDGSAWIDTPRGSGRVIRGGSWYFIAALCRVALRNFADPDYRLNFLGFRAAFVPQSGLAGGHSFGEGERAGGGSR